MTLAILNAHVHDFHRPHHSLAGRRRFLHGFAFSRATRQANGAFNGSGLSISLMAAVWRLKTGSHTEKLVLLALADNANDSGVCWPSVGTIAKKCNLSKPSVHAHLRALEAKNPPWLITTQNTGRSSTYKLSIPDLLSSLTPPVKEPNTPCKAALHPPVKLLNPEPSFEPSKNPKANGGLTSGQFWMLKEQMKLIADDMKALKAKSYVEGSGWSDEDDLEAFIALKEDKAKIKCKLRKVSLV